MTTTIGCTKCLKALPAYPLHDDKGGPLMCWQCAGAWHAEHTRRRKWGRIIIKAMKMYLKEGGTPFDFRTMEVRSYGYDVPGFGADTLGIEVGDITSELLANTIELTHPDKHPPERQEIANRVTQDLLALKPFVFPAPKPEPSPKPEPRNTSKKVTSAALKDPLRINYPCDACALTVPYYYCDPCHDEWEKRHQKEQERNRVNQRRWYAQRKQRLEAFRRPTACGMCDEKVEAKRKDAAYCSAACRQRAHRQRQKITNTGQSPEHLAEIITANGVAV